MAKELPLCSKCAHFMWSYGMIGGDCRRGRREEGYADPISGKFTPPKYRQLAISGASL